LTHTKSINEDFINPFALGHGMDDEKIHTKALFVSDHPVHQCCEEQMTYVGVETTWGEGSHKEEPDFSDSRYVNEKDYWLCYKCDNMKPSRKYRDWFGADDLDIEIYEYLATQNQEPLSVMVSGYMACVVWKDSVIVFGYDGNEYCHSFGFELESPKKGLLSQFNMNPPTLQIEPSSSQPS